MASYYVYSGASAGGNGTTWALAYQTLTLAFSGKVAGDIFYVAHDHSESTGAALFLDAPGTSANPGKVICVNRSGSVPPVSADRRTTAQVATTAANAISMSGSVHYDGLIFLAGSGASAAGISIPYTSNPRMRFDNCSLRLVGTGAGVITVASGGASGPAIEWNNVTVSFSAVGQSINVIASLKWRDTPSALIGSAVPTSLFTLVGGNGGKVECIGVDLSAAGSGKTIVGTVANARAFQYKFIDCKLDAAVTKAGTTGPGSFEADFIRTGASGINYSVFCFRWPGTLTEETTIVRTGGASDGTTPISWKVITTANCNYSMPFECPPIAIWNDTTGSAKTATVEGIWGGGAVPNDDDVWLDVEYLGSSSSPQGSFVNDGKADLLATAVNQTTSSETWGGALTGKFKVAVTFTPQQKGFVYARVKIGKASSTLYVDPLVTLT